jgi:hypothetical protein
MEAQLLRPKAFNGVPVFDIGTGGVRGPIGDLVSAFNSFDGDDPAPIPPHVPAVIANVFTGSFCASLATSATSMPVVLCFNRQTISASFAR